MRSHPESVKARALAGASVHENGLKKWAKRASAKNARRLAKRALRKEIS